jgi:G3E family GTPase
MSYCCRADASTALKPGLADPLPVLATTMAEPVIRHHFRLGQMLTTVGGVNGLSHLARQPEPVKQAVVADHIVITKTDIAATATVRGLSMRLRHLNPTATLLQMTLDCVPDASSPTK